MLRFPIPRPEGMSSREYEAYQLYTLAEAGAEHVRIHAASDEGVPRTCRESHGYLLSMDEAMALAVIPHELEPGRECECTYRPGRA